MRPSEQCLKLSVSFSGFRPPKLALSPATNPERDSRSVVMENGSLVKQDPDNKTENFGHS